MSHKVSKKGVAEERKGLLSGESSYFDNEDVKHEDDDHLDSSPDSEWSRQKIVAVACCLIALLIFGAFAPVLLLGRAGKADSHPDLYYNGDEVRSNGTHDFRRTVLIMSIDGLRCAAWLVIIRS
jgi:hypothetical protein